MNTISLENLKQEETSHKIVVEEHDIPMDFKSSSRKDREFNCNYFAGSKVYPDQKKIRNLMNMLSSIYMNVIDNLKLSKTLITVLLCIIYSYVSNQNAIGQTTGPGGVTTDLEIWLKADQGTNTQVNGETVTSWIDQSGSRTNPANSTTGLQQYIDAAGPNFNFNPVIRFDGEGGFTFGDDFFYTPAAKGGLSIYAALRVSEGQPSTKTVQSVFDYGNLVPNGYGFTFNEFTGVAFGPTASGGANSGFVTHNIKGPVQVAYELDFPNGSQTFRFWQTSGSINSHSLTELNATNITASATHEETTGPISIGRQAKNSGFTNNSTKAFLGTMGELFHFNRKLTDQEKQRIESYMAIKYGFTPSQIDVGNPNSPGMSLLNSSGQVVWDASVNSDYHHRLTAIGRDDLSTLHQRQSRSNHRKRLFELGNNNIIDAISNNSSVGNDIGTDGSFLVIGDNGRSQLQPSWAFNGNLQGGNNYLLSTTWKSQETGTIGSVQLKFYTPLSGRENFIPGSLGRSVYLVVSPDDDFTDTNNTLILLSQEGNDLVANVDLNDGDYFTLMTYMPAPGGVSAGLQHWLKADFYVQTNASNGALAWLDASPFGRDIRGINSPLFSPNAINFNPTINFSAGGFFRDNIQGATLSFTRNFTAGEVIGLFKNATNNVKKGAPWFYGSGSGNYHFTWDNGAIYDPFGTTDRLGYVPPNGSIVDVKPGVSAIQHRFNALDWSLYNTYSRAGRWGINRNANVVATTGNNTVSFGLFTPGSVPVIHIGASSGNLWDGILPEVILYDRVLEDTERAKVNTYLAIKYGLTIDQNYLATDNSVIWDATANAAYHHRVTGIYRADVQGLHQRQSVSLEADGQLTIGNANIVGESNSPDTGNDIATDESALIIGDDAKNRPNGTWTFNTNLPDGNNYRFSTTWKAQEIGNIGSVRLQFNTLLIGSRARAIIGALGQQRTLLLAVSPDEDFTDTNNTLLPMRIEGDFLVVDVDLEDGQYFTFLTYMGAPGGVAEGLTHWLKADFFVQKNEANKALVWYDASPFFRDMKGQSTSGVTVLDNNINFNPNIEFTGGYFRDAPITNGGRNWPQAMKQGEVFGMVRGSSTNVRRGFPWDYGSGQRNSHWTWSNGAIYDGFGTTQRFAYDPVTRAIVGAKTGIGSVQQTFSTTEWSLYNTASRAGRWEINRNGQVLAATNTNTVSFAGPASSTLNVHIGAVSGDVWRGLMPEVMLYERTLTGDERQRVNTYLALKYGMTINHNYMAPNGDVLWDRTTNTAFHNRVIGIYRSDIQELHQRQSSVLGSPADRFLFIGNNETIDWTNGNSPVAENDLPADESYLILGDNNGSLNFSFAFYEDKTHFLMDRKWKAQTNGITQATNITVLAHGNNSPSTVPDIASIREELLENQDVFLAIDANGDGDWSDATFIPMTLTDAGSGNDAWTANASIPDGALITIAIMKNTTDTDGDGVFDIDDLDNDNDGIPDVVEKAGSYPLFAIENINTTAKTIRAKAMSGPDAFEVNMTLTGAATLNNSTTDPNLAPLGGHGLHYSVNTSSTSRQTFTTSFSITPLEPTPDNEQSTSTPMLNRVEFGINTPKIHVRGNSSNEPSDFIFNWPQAAGVYAVIEDPLNQLSSHNTGDAVAPGVPVVQSGSVGLRVTDLRWKVVFYLRDSKEAFDFSVTQKPNLTSAINHEFFGINIFATREVDDDLDGIPNYLDLDSDDDGCFDSFEAGSTTTASQDVFTAGFGINGWVDALENNDSFDASATYTSAYFNARSATIQTCLDTDGDGIFDGTDIDDDNDGILDSDEMDCGEAFFSVPDITPNLLGYRQFEGGMSKGQAYADYRINFFNLSANLNNTTDIDISNGGLHYKVTSKLLYYSTNIILTPSEPSVLNTIAFGPQVPSNAIAANTKVGVQTLTLDWNSDYKAMVHDPDNQLNLADGTILTAGMSVATTADRTVAQSTWKIIFEGNQTDGEFDLKIYHAFTSNPSGTLNRNYAQGWGINTTLCFIEDFDNDGIPNHLDTDSDGDGCNDAFEANATTDQSIASFSGDVGVNGLLNSLETTPDSGVISYVQSIYLAYSQVSACADSDGDGIPDRDDIDDDNDGILDVDEYLCGPSKYVNSYTIPSGVSMGAGGSFNNGDIRARVIYQFSSLNTIQSFVSGQNSSSYRVNDADNAYTYRATISPATSSISEVRFGPGLEGNTNTAVQNAAQSIVVSWNIGVGGIIVDPENQLSSHTDGVGISSGATITTNAAYTVAESKWYVVIPINYLTRDFVFNAAFSGTSNFGEESFGIAVNLCSKETDLDGDGLPNAIDTDSDGDGCFDAVESQSGQFASLSSETIGGSYGQNGLSSLIKTDDTPIAKTNYELSYDFLNDRIKGCLDTDNDGIPDEIDIDDDNDGVLDEVECPSEAPIASYTWVPDQVSDSEATYKLIANTGKYLADVTIKAVQNLRLHKFGIPANPNELIKVNPDDNSVSGGMIDLAKTRNANRVLQFIIKPAPDVAALDLEVLGTEGGNGGWWFHPRRLRMNGGAAGNGKIVGIPQPYYMRERHKVGDSVTPSTTFTTRFKGALGPTANKQYVNVSYRQLATEEKPFVLTYTWNTLLNTFAGENYAFQILRLGIQLNEFGPCDHDGDGIPNSLDPDSDNDGCNDGVEAGVIPLGTTVPLQGEVGANGFMDYLETAPESGIYKGNYSYPYALNDQIDGCEDFDGDGIPDLIDIDDDNDGVLDHIESPSCFLTAAEWNNIDKMRQSMLLVSSDLITLVPNVNFSNLIDNDQNTDAIQFLTSTAQAQLNKTIFLFDFTRPVQLDAIYIKKASGTNIFANVTGSVMVQGSNDFSTWTDLMTAAVNPANATHTTANGGVVLTNSNKLTLNDNPDAYKFYRIVGAAAGNIQSGIATEVYFDVNTNVYNPSNYPKIGQCMVDTDGDGQPNHLDLDSDGDGCFDAYESSTTTTKSQSVIPGPYGDNGFADNLETASESGMFNGTYTYYFANDKDYNVCIDSDGDGIPDLFDLDNDNDGILDADECQTIDYQWGSVYTPNADGTVSTTIDGIEVTYSSTQPITLEGPVVAYTTLPSEYGVPNSNPAIRNTTANTQTIEFDKAVRNPVLAFTSVGSNTNIIVPIEFSDPVEIVWTYEYPSSAGPPSGNGTKQTSPTTIVGAEGHFIVKFSGLYKTISFDYTVEEFYSNVVIGYQTLTYCDTDGDGIPNYLDLDSDGDGCPDAVEAGTAQLAQSLGYSVSSDGVVAGPYGANGFADYLEDEEPESGNYRDTYTYDFAITVGAASTITSHPEGVKVFGDGQTATFTAVVDDSEASSTPIYQWQISTNGGATWKDVTNSDTYEGATTSELKVNNIDGDMNGHRFRLSVSQADFACGTYFSDAAKLSVDGLPEAIDDIVTVPQGESAEGNILTNDSKREGSEGTLSVKTFQILDADGDPLDGPFVLGTPYVIPGVGTLTLNADGTFKFDPLDEFFGKVPTVIYQMEDSEGGTDRGTLSITATKENKPPVANDQDLTTDEDTPLTGNLLTNGGATDPDGDPLKITEFTIDGVTYNAGTTVDIPGVGVIKINEDGSFEFTPALNYNGEVPPVTYTVVDVNGGKDTATLNITVDPVNDAPLAADDIVGTTEGTNAIGNVLTNDTDVDGDLLTVTQFVVDGKTVTIDPSTGGTESLEGIGTITINADGSFTFVPDPEFRQGQVPTITYTISDGSATTTAKLDIFVEPVPKAPTAADDTATLTEDSILTCTTGNCNLLDNDAVDPLFPDLQLKITQINFTVEGKEYTYPVGVDAVIPGVGIVKVNEDGTYEFKPDANWYGTVPAITYTITDGEGNTANADLNITVTPVNDAPIAVDDNVTTRKNEPVSGNVLTNDSDVDNDKEDLTVTQFEVNGVIYPVSASTPGTVTIPNVGTLTVKSDGTFTFTPEAGYTGAVPPVTYTVSDGEDISTANLNIVVSEFNQPPVANNDVATTDDQTPAQGNVLSNDKDDDVNDVLEVVSFTINGITYSAGRIVEIPEVGEFTLQADGTYTFVPVPGFNGDVPTITYTITDGFGGVDSASLNIKVTIKDSDGDGVPDFQEILDGTDPNDPCSFDPANQVDPSAEWLAADCDGDGISNGDELAAGTNPLDPCDFSMEDFDITKTSAAWKALDCDGDGISNGDELAAGTNPLDPCDFSMEDFDITKTSAAWKALDCDGDGVLNGEDSCPLIFADNGLGCPLPIDFNVTDINVPVTGDVSTNDEVPAGTTYGTPVADEDNPAGATLTMNPDGTYAFNATEPGVYTYMVPVCGPGQTEDCPLSPLQITVLDPLADDNAPVVNPDIATAKEDSPVVIDVLANDASGNVGTELDPESLTITEPKNGTVTINADGTVTYTPDEGFTGEDTFTYTVCDTGDPANCQTGTVTVTVLPEDMPEVTTAGDDFAVVQANGDGTATVSGNVLANDGSTDPDAKLTASLVTDPATLPGTLVFNADGTYTFTPDAGFAGPVEVVYTVCDDQDPANCSTATLHILVEPAPKTPVDFNVTDINVPVTGDVSTNDEVPAGTTYGTPVADEDNPAGATLTMNPDGTYEFNATEPGVYTYMVPVCGPGQTEDCPMSPLQITVLDPLADDNEPVVNPDIATAKEDSPVVIDVLANDASGNVGTELDPESLTITEPKNGTVTINADGTVTYTPDEGFTGEDTFTYTVCDSSDPAICQTGTVTVTVLPEDMPEVTTAGDDFAVVQANAAGTATVSGNVLDNDSNTDPDAELTASLVTDPATLPGTLVFNADGTYTFTPDAGFAGPVEVVYTVCDDQDPANCSTATLHILVEPAPQIPVDFNVTDINVPVTGDLSTNDVVPAGTTYGTPIADTDNPAGATITVNADGTYEFNATEPGVYTYMVPVCGPGQTEDCPMSPLQITVLDPLADDNEPVVNPDIATAKEDSPVVIDVLANDASGNVGTELDPESLTITEPKNGTVTINADGTVTYTPDEGFTGTDTFTYTVCDTGDPANCQTGTVTVTVVPEDMAEVTTAGDDFAVVQANGDGTATVSGNVLANDSNTDPDAELTASLVTDPATLPGTLVFNADGTYTFTPDAGFAGPVEVVYTVCDDQDPANCSTATLHILVEPAPKTPVDFNVTDINVPVTGDVSTNDEVPAGTTYGTPVADEDNPAGATLTMNPDGTYEFNATEPGVYTYMVPVCGPGQTEDCPLSPLQITVLDPLADDNEPVVNPDIATAKEDSPVVIDVLANDASGNVGTELDPESLTITEQPENGTVIINADGTVTYTPDEGFTGEDTFTYTVCDSSDPAICDTAEVTVTVLPEDMPEVTTAGDDFAVVQANAAGTATVSGNVLANDSNTDPDAELTASLVTDPATLPGTLVFNADGTYTFTPDAGFAGPVEVVYKVCDDATPASCSTATLHILVEPAPQIPVDFNVTDINVPVTGDVSTNDEVPAGTTYGTPVADEDNPAGATLTMNPDGTYEFNATEPGVYTYMVPVCGPGQTEDCPMSPLQITVLDPLADDNEPVVNPDIATAKEDSPVVIDVLANDASGNVGTELDPESLTITEQPKNGTVTINADGTVTYTPDEGFTGEDTFTYTVCDTGDPANCQTGTVTVTVVPEDMAEVTTAGDDFAVVQANADGTATVSGNVLANDSNTDPDAELTASLVTDPATLPGTLVFNADGTYTFTPDAGFAGPVEVVYTVCDDATPASCSTATLHILVEPAPQIPVDFNVTDINVPVTGDVSTNDEVPAGTTYGTPVADEDNPAGATLTMNPDGTYEFNATEPGVYTYMVPVCGPGQTEDCPMSPLQITVLDPLADDNEPVVNPDIATAKEDSPVVIDVLANDASGNVGTELDPESLTITEQPKNGTVTINADGTVTYTPDEGFTGEDTFTYTVCDSSDPAICQTGTVTVTVLPEDMPEVTTAGDDFAVVQANADGTATVSGNVLDNDSNTDPDAELTASLVTDPATLPGTLVFNADGTYTFTPDAGFAGPVEVVYTVCDDQDPANCSTATLHILVEPAPKTPVDFNVTDINVPVTGDVSTNDEVPAGTTYGTPVADEDNPAGATLTMNPDGTYAFTATEPGVYTYMVPVCGPGQTEDCPLVALQITVLDPMANDNAPVVNPDIATAKEDSPVVIDVLANDASGNVGMELDPESLTITEEPENGTVTINADGTVTYTPDEGFVGTDTFTYTVCDSSDPAKCSTTEVYVTVTPEEAPDVTLAADDYAVVGGTVDGTNSVSGNVLGNDSNTDPDAELTASLVTDPATLPGTLVFNEDGTYTFTPTPGFSGPVSVVYTACGGDPVSCATATLYILVEPVLDPQPDFNATFAGVPVKGDVSTNDALPAGTTYGTPTADLRNPAEAVIKMNPDGTYEFEAPLPGVYNFTVPVCTPDGECVETLLTITVYSKQDANGPVVTPDLGLTEINTPVVLNTLVNDRSGRPGVELDPASVVIAQQPANGTVKVDPVTGNITYTPNPGFTGTDTYTYTVCDTGNPVLCSTTVQKITVLGEDAPNSILASDDFGSAPTSGVVTGNVLSNDMDPDKNNMTVTPQQVEREEGVFTMNADGTYEFVPAPGFTGPISFVYTVCDNGTPQACATATLYILITPNDLEANMDNFQDNEVNGLTGGTAGNVLDNDKINGNPIKASDVNISVKDDGGMAGVSIDKDGNLIVPKGTAPGTYVITYTICDVLDPTNCDEAIAIVEVFHGVNLMITKQVEAPEWFEGDEFGFTLTVENNGQTDASQVLVKDQLPEGLTYVSSVIDGATAVTTVTGNQISWTVSELSAGSSFQIQIKVKAEPLADGRELTLVNTATVESIERELSESDNSSSAAVKVKPFFIPNTITPNGDGVNDTFVIPGLGRYVSNEILIFNRWGDHVYERKNYQNDWSADGLVSGTYFYLLKVTDKNGTAHEYKGFIQVVKERIR